MKKFFVLFTLCALLSTGLYAKTRSLQEAQQIANSFVGNTGNLKKGTRVASQLAFTREGSSQPLYYVFNKGAGFVIVSADDRATEILGYSDAGSFDADNLPDNFRYWLGGCADELEALAATPESATVSQSVELPARSTGKTVAPLLGSILWDQTDPYNSLCPNIGNGERAAVGCVATAMAQIMGYHQWPKKGIQTLPGYTTASRSYKISRIPLSEMTYDWSLITPVYTSESTEAEKAEVAKLMYHCGVSVKMDYGPSSGAISLNVPNALINYFGYNASMKALMRDYYTKTEWESIIRKELDESRPVYYYGSGSDGGHAFVCDGYDANGLFHINWGWSGMSNGYFALSGLTPSIQGTGGNSTGFNFDQGAIIGIQRETTEEDDEYQIYIDKTFSIFQAPSNRNTPFDMLVEGFWNMDYRGFNGKIGSGLYSESGELVDTLGLSDIELPAVAGWDQIYFPAQIPETVVDGTYRIYLIYQTKGSTDYQIIRSKVGQPNYIQVTLNGSRMTFSNATGYDVDLRLDNLEVEGNLYQNEEGRFKYTVTNQGVEYVSALVLQLVSTTSSQVSPWESINPVAIAPGETQTFEVSESITLPAGEYDLYLCYDPNNSYENIRSVNAMGESKRVTILAEPTAGTPDLQLVSPLSFADNNHVNRADMNLTVTMVNRGDYFYDDVVAFIFPEESGSQSVASLGLQPISLAAGEEREVNFSGAVNLPYGTYFMSLYYWNDNDWQLFGPKENNNLAFTLTESTTALASVEADALTVYPNPVRDVLYVQAPGELTDISIYDLSGRRLLHLQPEVEGEVQLPVADLQSGSYMLVVRTAQDVKTTQFIKQ